MEHLKVLIDQLKRETDTQAQIQILQNIGSLLITDYVIQVKNLILEPLWVEAYYFSLEKFSDCNAHLHDRQKEHFQQLYVHRAGVDLCLSDGDYYLSFLLKMAYLYPVGRESDKQFCKQTALREHLLSVGPKEELEMLKEVLLPRDRKRTARYAKRINMEKPCYRDAPLAVFALEEISSDLFKDFHPWLQEPAVEYMKEYISNHPNGTKKEYENECRRVFGWLPDVVYNLYRHLP